MQDPVRAVNVGPVVDWLMAGCRPLASDAKRWLPALCDRMRACGLRFDRLAVFIRPLHPNVVANGYYWRAGAAEIEVTEEGYGFIGSDEHLASPIRVVTSTRRELRFRLFDPVEREAYPVLQELHGDGFTDYLITPLEFVDGEVHVLSVATRSEGGFDAAEIAAIRRVRPAVTRMIEILGMRHRMVNILDAYLGRNAGRRVLEGRIRRGETERIDAVIWFCDLRDSTVLADAIGPERFLATLNDYFETVLAPVMVHGGEVLSFVGDAALAIFPVGDDLDGAATRAVTAAREAIDAMRTLNERRERGGAPALRFGIGLHLGDVLYGNVGTPERIAFTVVGPATNEAARIESLCKTLDATPLVSASVARHADFAWRALGTHHLRGVDKPVELFTL